MVSAKLFEESFPGCLLHSPTGSPSLERLSNPKQEQDSRAGHAGRVPAVITKRVKRRPAMNPLFNRVDIFSVVEHQKQELKNAYFATSSPRFLLEAAQAAFRSVLEHCSNVLKKISTTFQSLDERQQRLGGNETVPLIVPILTNIETQLSQYDILAAVFHVSAVQTTQIAMPYRDQWNDHCRGHLSSITSKRCGSIAPAVYRRRGGRSIPISLKRKDVYRIIAEVF